MKMNKDVYEVPVCTVLQLEASQVLCASQTGVHDGFEEDYYPW